VVSIAEAGITAIRTITIVLPRGVAFARSRGAGVTVHGLGGRRLKFSSRRRRGTITIRLAAPAPAVTIASAAMSVTRTLADQIRAGRVKTITVRVTAGRTFTLRLRV
jgi:hypothetical protein